jgi:hypothetical protein
VCVCVYAFMRLCVYEGGLFCVLCVGPHTYKYFLVCLCVYVHVQDIYIYIYAYMIYVHVYTHCFSDLFKGARVRHTQSLCCELGHLWRELGNLFLKHEKEASHCIYSKSKAPATYRCNILPKIVH